MTDKPKKNLILGTTPMFSLIMKPVAEALFKKLCVIKQIQDSHFQDSHYDPAQIDCLKEVSWTGGKENDNLEQCKLPVGTQGMVIGVAEPSTVLRFLVVSGNSETSDKALESAIYHVSVLNLALLKEEPRE